MAISADHNIGSITQQLISLTNGLLLNAHDGTFMASKMCVEFGYLGLAITVFIAIVFIKSLAHSRSDHSSVSLFHLSATFSLLIYTFIRGGGYFAFPVLLALIASNLTSQEKQSFGHETVS